VFEEERPRRPPFEYDRIVATLQQQPGVWRPVFKGTDYVAVQSPCAILKKRGCLAYARQSNDVHYVWASWPKGKAPL
jgi:hypothetical protein